MDYFRFLKEQQERSKLKKEKRLKAREERKLKEKEQEKKRLNITKILLFPAQIIIAAFLVLIILFIIFYAHFSLCEMKQRE